MVCDSFRVFVGCAWLVIRLVIAALGAEQLHLGVYDIGLLSCMAGIVLLLLWDRTGARCGLLEFILIAFPWCRPGSMHGRKGMHRHR